MYLRRLDLVGFKSFATRTTTEFQPGIVVIVGPNGSGKSNVSDALLWVLGEQSSKAVRARKAEEVIFAGSASRQPLGMAEVSLVLDNTDSSLPIDFDEVRVTRRLYRSGESEYLLNGARVRLKDITQLLLHAGLSPDSYAVVGQGSIDELILQRPDERRVVFENVADIRRHQLRLNETRSKLASTQANLTRVEDILAELTPHVRRLKTQAERAERAEQARTELHGLLLRTFRVRFLQARATQRAAAEDAERATQEAEQAVAEALAGEGRVHEVDGRLAGMDGRLAELRPRAEAIREQVRAAERTQAVLRERLASTIEQRAVAEGELARQNNDLDRLADEEREAALAERSGDAQPERQTDLDRRRAELAAAVAELEAAQAERIRHQRTIDQADTAMREIDARLGRTSQQLHSLQANVAVDQARQGDRESRLASIQQQLDLLQQELTDFRSQQEHTQSRLAAATAAHASAAERLETAREELRVVSQQADRLHGALQALGATDLDRLDATDLPDEWRTVLQGLPVVGLAGDLASRIRPIDLLLAGYVRRIVVLSNDAATREAHRRLRHSLANSAAAWAVLSMDGLLLTGEGARPLEVLPDHGQSALADWSRQVRELETELQRAESRRRAALAEVQSARDGLDDAEADERGARLALGEIEAHRAELRRAEAAAQAEVRELQSARDRAVRAASQRQEERERAVTRARTLEDEVVVARQKREALSEQARLAEEAVAALAERVANMRADVAAHEAAAGRLEAERAARAALHARIVSEIASTSAAREATQDRLQRLAAQVAEMQTSVRQLDIDLAALRNELAPVDDELASAEQRRGELFAERQLVDQDLAVLRAAERAAHENREAHHVAAQRASDELERLKTEINETAELEAELAGDAVWAEQLRLAFADEEAALPHESFDVDAARRRIATLQRELRSIGGGGVAASVVEEYRELSERHRFLEQQSADLHAAMGDLENAASELEAHMRERFSETFGAIQTAFQECFAELFGGGEARLVLTDPDDLLRTGIDIIARPPGKKLQGLLSLSGGERALTVVSLLFGLLKINPTPFCVLDEVDAALDEANVQRFANLLADFAQRIQFIVVTHNRATMDKADAMYGVSMDAAGMSHVFSVRPGAIASERTRREDKLPLPSEIEGRGSGGGEPISDGGEPISDGGEPISDGGEPISDGGEPIPV